MAANTPTQAVTPVSENDANFKLKSTPQNLTIAKLQAMLQSQTQKVAQLQAGSIIAPPPMPPGPAAIEPGTQAAGARAAGASFGDTIITGPEGLKKKETVTNKSLLGS